MSILRGASLLACVGLLALLAACSGAETSDSAGTVSTTSAAPGEAAGAEAPSVTFTHPSLGWSIAGPSTMTVDGTGAAYTGRSDYLRVTTVDGSSDAPAAAKTASTGTSVAGFALRQGPKAVQISGVASSYLEYTRADVVNPVTGKAQVAHVLLAFVPRTGGVYRLEYGATVPDASWDPQGALDIVTTFRAGK